MNEQMKQQALRKIRAAQFVRDNGRVLRTINLLRHKFEALRDILYALDNLDDRRFLDCINFLSEVGYIQLREIDSKTPASLSDTAYEKLEAKLSAQGIRLLGGGIKDEMVDI